MEQCQISEFVQSLRSEQQYFLLTTYYHDKAQ